MIREPSPLALREALAASGLVPRFLLAENRADAVEQARRLGMPVIVRPAARYATAGTRLIEHPEDVPLAFAVARRSDPGPILIEPARAGSLYYVLGVAGDENTHVYAIAGRVPSEPPHCFDWCIYAPVHLPDETRRRLAETARTTCDCIKWQGAFCLDVITTEQGPVVSGFYSSERIAPWRDGLQDTSRGMAVAWVRPRTGIVTGVAGISEARETPGVIEVRVGVRKGDTLGHPADEETRNRAGFVRAAAENGEAALEIARRACALIQIETSPFL
ncbi:MAG TPA: hypothetical protein PKO36_03380 [Candidatus Hydrogenedentes bacterium]|nr:hypothetical protein [Candidatus Hydrogenedentota bacterium]HOV75607.1 hypothetical protein [Candidatus Hydrogenedentota bacterium]HPC17302.1 hypothetical protein [Candidatus Hydrogenedentota bacterium]HRT20425.1 hypothetical protein [Candidatus Hydrogenedentota bacterium]HRT66408.1 hypothetical protein [Candidatus Hydrogenedentota bacterium]